MTTPAGPVDSYIQLQSPADSSGPRLDSTRITRPDGTVVERQRLDVVNKYHRKLFSTMNGTGRGQRIDLTGYGPLTDWALQVRGVDGAPTAWTVNLEVSLDGLIYQRIVQHTTTTMNGGVVWAMGFPALHAQIYVASLSLAPASAIEITAIGL
jgi:hypothetical protein